MAMEYKEYWTEGLRYMSKIEETPKYSGFEAPAIGTIIPKDYVAPLHIKANGQGTSEINVYDIENENVTIDQKIKVVVTS